MILLRQKYYTKYDETDNLKRMKDSDILAEKKKDQNYGSTVASGLNGAVIGTGAGAITGAVLKRLKKKGKFSGKIVGAKKGAGIGAAAGALIGAGTELAINSRKRKENREYNDRLEYAQEQAKRREGANWKSSNTQKENYTY